MNIMTAFNRAVEVHTNILTTPELYTAQAINDFDDYVVEIAEAMIAEVCDGDLPMTQRHAALARLRVLVEIRMQITEAMVRKAFGMSKISVPLTVH